MKHDKHLYGSPVEMNVSFLLLMTVYPSTSECKGVEPIRLFFPIHKIRHYIFSGVPITSTGNQNTYKDFVSDTIFENDRVLDQYQILTFYTKNFLFSLRYWFYFYSYKTRVFVVYFYGNFEIVDYYFVYEKVVYIFKTLQGRKWRKKHKDRSEREKSVVFLQ